MIHLVNIEFCMYEFKLNCDNSVLTFSINIMMLFNIVVYQLYSYNDHLYPPKLKKNGIKY